MHHRGRTGGRLWHERGHEPAGPIGRVDHDGAGGSVGDNDDRTDDGSAGHHDDTAGDHDDHGGR
jgi:hypothetical protein